MEPLPAAAVADACVRLAVPFHALPGSMQVPGAADGPALAVRHHGSVDVFLEALDHAAPGDVLVIDNQGRPGEGCIGDLTGLECQAAGIAGIVVWGRHRDHGELQRIALPIWSQGACPVGPRGVEGRVAAIGEANVDGVLVRSGDRVIADADGALHVHARHWDEVAHEAARIVAREREQASRMRQGSPLRAQLRFQDYLDQRRKDPTYTLRRHLQAIGAAIEA